MLVEDFFDNLKSYNTTVCLCRKIYIYLCITVSTFW